MEEIIIGKDRAKQVLNFKFNTNMLFKCTIRKYAEDMLDGNLFFNMPEKWIEIEEISQNKGQGDSLEGTFLTTDENDNSTFISNLKLSDDIEHFKKNNKLFFRRKSVKKLFCYCLYGLNDNSFVEKSEDRFGNVNFCSRIDKNYFSGFSDVKEEEYFKIQEGERPAVVFISNPHEFFERIRNALVELGVKREDVIVSPVEYVDRNNNSIALLPYPHELLLKDISFKNQSEIRIIINSEDKSIIQKIKENNQIINIGNINDIASIYDFYFNDLILMKDGNSVLFTLPFPENIPIEKLTLRKLLSIFVQTSNDQLPYEMSIEDRIKIINAIKKVIKNKYGMEIGVKNGMITAYGYSGDINEILDK